MTVPSLELAYCAVKFHPSVVSDANRRFGDPESEICFETLARTVDGVYDIIRQHVPVILQEDFDGPDDGFAEDLGMSSLNGKAGWLQFQPVPENRRAAAPRLAQNLVQGHLLQHDDITVMDGDAFGEGGDVIIDYTNGNVFVGLCSGATGRTNGEGRAVIRRFVEAHGGSYIEVPFDATKALHLTTCSSFLGPNRDGRGHFLCNSFVDARKYKQAGYGVIMVEGWRANALYIPADGAPLLLQAGDPDLTAAVRAAGYDKVLEIPWDEVKKADGSLTCLGKFVRLRSGQSSPLS